MMEIHCVNCNVLLGYHNSNIPTGFFYCIDCGDKEKEEDEKKEAEWRNRQ